jgi:RNA polymerase sigma-70 factor, ECF subfamily
MCPTVERQLIRRAQQGDPKAIEGLIRGHQDPLYAFMLRLTGRPDVAEDMVQEAFVRVLRNLDRFDSNFRFSTWLFTIAKRLYVNYTQKLRPSYDSDTVGACAAQGHTPNHQSEHEETIGHVRGMLDEAMAELSAQQREIVRLFHQQNWSITAIAAHLKMPEGTIKSHLHRARRRMRRLIDQNALLRRRAAEAL